MPAIVLAASIAALLAHAKPGDTVVLPVGDYANETIADLTFSPPVSLDARQAKGTAIALRDVTGLHITGGIWANAIGETWAGRTWATAISCERCHDVIFDGVTVTGPPSDAPGRDFAGYGISFLSSDHVAATNSKFTGFRMGLGFTMTADFVARGNDFGFMTSDGIDVAQGWRGLIEDNVFHDTHIIEKEHPDGIQMWSRSNAPPTSDIVIRRNRVTGGSQGISGFGGADSPYERITIEDNDVTVGYPNGIALVDGHDSVIRNNHVATMKGAPNRASFNIKPDDGGTKHCGNVAEPGAGKGGWSDGDCPKR